MAKQHCPHHNCTICKKHILAILPIRDLVFATDTQLQTAVSLYNMMNMIREAQGQPRRVYQTAQGLADQQSPLARTWQASRRASPSHPVGLLISGH
jgi:hypothetical protein